MPSLESLPPEVLFNTLSYTSAFDPFLDPHPFDVLAATSKHLKAIVEEYARGLLKQHANIKPPKSSKIFTCRRKWKRWLASTCQFCQNKTKRRATLDQSIPCCRACDRTRFPKMTMTVAKRTFGLTNEELFTPNDRYPDLEPLRVGSYYCYGAYATMFAVDDIFERKVNIATLKIKKGWGNNVTKKVSGYI